MTAVNAIASGARGRMVTDSASYLPDGTLSGFVVKAVPMPHLGLVFACRGMSAARWAMAEEIQEAGDIDALVTRGADALRAAHEARAFGEEFDLTVMGWSPARRRVVLYTLSSIAHPGLAPFTFHGMRVSLAPLPDDDALRQIGLKVGSTFDTSDPEAKLLALIDLQRVTPAPLGAEPDAPIGYGVGGAAVLTEVTEAGIAQRVIRRWPDEIGGPLIPDGAPAPPTRPRPALSVVA